MADAITGKSAKRQAALAAEAQRRQEERLAEQERKVAAVEEGQRRVRMGGRGLLAFVDNDLSQTFGATDQAAAKKKYSGTGNIFDSNNWVAA